MVKHKTKYIFECTGPSELTMFNETYNKSVKAVCERSKCFAPDLHCLSHGGQDKPCSYLKIHTYTGDK